MRLLSFLHQNAPWLAAGGLMTLMSSFGQTFFISIFAGEIRDAFGLSHGAWGGIYSLGTATAAVVMVWSGALTDQFRVRVLGPVVLVGLAVSCIAMSVNSAVWVLPAVVFALRLFGQGMCSHIAVVAMARWFTATRGRALSIATLGFALGEAVLPVSFVALMTVVDWHLLWLAAAAFSLLGIPVLLALLKQERTLQSLAEQYSSTGMQGRHWTRHDALRHPLFWMMVPAILGPSAFNTAFFFHQVHFADIKGWSHVELVSFFPVFTAMGIVSMVLSGWALDRVGTARLMPFYQLPMVLSFLVFSTASGFLGALIGFLFLAMTTGSNSTLPNAFWAEFYGTAHIGAIKAMAAAVMVLGSALGPGVTGLLIDLGIGLERQFVGISIYFLITSALMFAGIRKARADLTP
ncbi:MFS transporter [Sedimentitalea sp. JM2-8]|uniref:MFS transporter n=1 Tax=Sedimentitalea xiamensis TaxID=3050037 RepID=A0ABT7F9L2_9RHOB|nr:MFS transporter [Sedimentitalea xiamensis]MDK3071791.1 MFS transporter [Sedimentitalea xiamensis]